jgi:hypothetical protein
MRARILTTALAVVVAAAGCRSLGWVDEGSEDWGKYQTPAGTMLKGTQVRVVSIKPNLAADPAAAEITLKNEGDGIALFSLDVEFGFPKPAESFAPYTPHFESEDIENFEKGATQVIKVAVAKAPPGRPHFVRIPQPSGNEVRVTTDREVSRLGQRQGSTFLRGKVEVVDVEDALSGDKPRLAFTLENIDTDPASTGKPVGDIRYAVQFYKDGKPVELPRKFSAWRAVGKPLGARGEKVTFEVAGLDDESLPRLTGTQYVLRLKQ